MARTRAGKLHRIWKSDLPIKLKLRLYISAVCSILSYGSEAWLLDDRACRAINGANAAMLSHITGNTIRHEPTATTTTFQILRWIRVSKTVKTLLLQQFRS